MKPFYLDLPVLSAKNKLAARKVFRIGRYPNMMFVTESGKMLCDEDAKREFANELFDQTMSPKEKSRVFKEVCLLEDSSWPRLKVINDKNDRSKMKDGVLNVCEW
jgi:hypothetical protein